MKKPLTILLVCLALTACEREAGGNEAANAGAQASDAKPAKEKIGAALADSADHRTLSQALEISGLEATLSADQPYTLFAPTDAAFAKLPSGGAPNLLRPENKAQLVDLLRGHIVPGLVTASDLAGAIERGKGEAKLATVSGSTLVLTRDGGSTLLAGPGGSSARVVGDERLQSNGAIHAVDGVLLPK
ncbi:MAG TPA: fasciclin domain-containing protein [Allosphingosinicella sp.]